MASTPLNHPSEVMRPETLEQRFRRLEAQWVAETGHLSSHTGIVGHPAYREIVNMGEAVAASRCPKATRIRSSIRRGFPADQNDREG